MGVPAPTNLSFENDAPGDGQADSWTFASLSSAYEYAGLLRSENMLLRSEEFDNAAWTKTGTTITADTTDPPAGLGDEVADELVEDASTGNHGVSQIATLGAIEVTFSAYVKEGTRAWVALYISGKGSGYFDLANEVIGVDPPSGEWIIESVGAGWFRILATVTIGAGAITYAVRAASADETDSYTGVLDDTALTIFGAQLTRAPAPGPYVRTEAAAITNQDGVDGYEHFWGNRDAQGLLIPTAALWDSTILVTALDEETFTSWDAAYAFQLSSTAQAQFDRGTVENYEDFEEEWNEQTATFEPEETTDLLTSNSHTLVNDDLVRLANTVSGGALPTGLSGTTAYYVISATTNTFQLSLTVAGSGASSPRFSTIVGPSWNT